VADDLDLTSLAAAPAPALVPAADIRARGDQRRRRSRVRVAAAGAVLVLAGSGTALNLLQSGKTQSLLVGNDPSATASLSSAPWMPRDAHVTWASFPTVTRMGALFPGEWVSAQVQVSDDIADSDRCDFKVVLPTARALVSRRLNTPGRQEQVVFMVQDFRTAKDAAIAFNNKQGKIHTCPTVVTDGPAGSQLTSTVLESSAGAFTARNVQHECLQDHADCKDSPGLQRMALVGHLMLTVTGYRSGDSTLSQSELRAFMDDFSQQVSNSYDKPAPEGTRPTTIAPETGVQRFAAFLWSGNVGQTNGEASEQQRASDWGNVMTAPLDCFEGGAAAVSRDDPQGSRGHAVAVLFSSAQEAENFVDLYDGHVEGVAPINIRCLN
jgi:hypothetical protein